MYGRLIRMKNIGVSFPSKDPTEMLLHFIYYRMLVDVAIFHGIIKGRLLHSLKARHCLHAAKIETPLMFHPPPFTHCHYYLYIYPDIPPRFLFISRSPPICTSCHNRSELMEGSRRNKGPERYMNIY